MASKARKIVRPVRVAGVRYKVGEEDKLHLVLNEDDAERLVKDGVLKGDWSGSGREAPAQDPRSAALAPGLQPTTATLLQADDSIAERERALADREAGIAERERALADRERVLLQSQAAPPASPKAAEPAPKAAEGAGKTG